MSLRRRIVSALASAATVWLILMIVFARFAGRVTVIH